MSSYNKADHEIREAVTKISNEHEIGQKDTVAILTYLIHDIMSIKEESDNGMQKGRVVPCEKCGSTNIVQTGMFMDCQECNHNWPLI